MNEQISPLERHPSYQRHQRQFWLQIFLPMIVAVLVVIAVAVLTGVASFNEGDSPRWAAISTIWLVIPMMIFGLLFLAILIGLVYLLARLLKVIPPSAAVAQYYTFHASAVAKRISDGAAKPVITLQGALASFKAIFGRD